MRYAIKYQDFSVRSSPKIHDFAIIILNLFPFFSQKNLFDYWTLVNFVKLNINISFKFLLDTT